MAGWRRISLGLASALAVVPVVTAGGAMALVESGGSAAAVPPATVLAAPMIPGGALPKVVAGAGGRVGYEKSSTNWSGYVVKATSAFTAVKGAWVQPSVTCSGTDTMAGFWVGIDGYGTTTVEQLGTAAECLNGTTPTYYAWWEMYPGPAELIPQSVTPGDTLNARVVRTGTNYRLVMVSSAGWKFATTKSSSSAANSSAEWIAEAPSTSSGVSPLADFGKMHFGGGEAADGGSYAPISTFTADSGPIEVVMTNSSGWVISQPTALFPSGKGFAVKYK